MSFLLYVLVGFLAQIIDGTLGMAYGVSCRTFLSTFCRVPSKVVSAVVHYAEVPVSLSSFISNLKFKNIDKQIFLKLTLFGISGSIVGAFLVTKYIWIFSIIIDIYLIIMGAIILSKGFKNDNIKKDIKNKFYLPILGFIGAFCDAIGGGGYGPIVTGSLIAKNGNTKKIIGSVNSSEFFVTLSSSIVFLLLINDFSNYFKVIIGLIIGGIIASPIAVKICLCVKEKILFIIVGFLLMTLNLYNLITMF